jgi:hypothetical protein
MDDPRDTDSKLPTRPRWVKVAIIVGILVLVVLILALTGVLGGQHGPGRHLPSGSGGDTPPQSVTGDGGHSPPWGFPVHGG